MADDKTSDSDLWVDRETGKLVKKQPARGTLVVREGGRITPAVQVRLDALDADPDADPVPAAVALGNEEPPKPAPVKKAAAKRTGK